MMVEEEKKAETATTTATAPRTSSVAYGTFKYVHPSTTVAHIGRSATGDDTNEPDNAQWQFQSNVPVHDVRARRPSDEAPVPSLHRHGVQLVQHPLSQPLAAAAAEGSSPIDFLDQQDVLERYYPQCEALVRHHLEQAMVSSSSSSPASEGTRLAVVKAFDHNVRISRRPNAEDDPTIKNGGESKVQSPLGLVHGDYTTISAPRRLQYLAQAPKINDVWRHKPEFQNQNNKNNYPGLLDPSLVKEAVGSLSEEEEATQSGSTDAPTNNGKQRSDPTKKRRYAIINVWRNIDPNRPVQQWPLACMNATTINPRQEFRTLQIHYPDRIGENFLVTYHPNHEWWYWSNMTHDEALLIKQWDSYGTNAVQNQMPSTAAVAVAPAADSTTTTIANQEENGDHNTNNRNNNNNDDDDDANHTKDNDFISTLCIHSAFELADSNVNERKSIEVRCVVIY